MDSGDKSATDAGKGDPKSTTEEGAECECAEGEGAAMESLEWKLANSKACPKCKIFIERDDGCNKVDCPYCSNVVRLMALLLLPSS